MLDDKKFWEIAQSQEFYERFQHRHPLVPSNGGRDFYNVENISALLTYHEKQISDHSLTEAARWRAGKSAETMRDWIAQIRWIERQAELRPDETWTPRRQPVAEDRPKKSFAEWSSSSES